MGRVEVGVGSVEVTRIGWVRIARMGRVNVVGKGHGLCCWVRAYRCR